jgi:DNA invertase Pin-like site-specific DNA recombinase
MTTLSSDTPRCSTDEQDLTVQREGLAALGVTADRDLRRSRADRLQPRPTGLREALAACREGDSLFVTNSIDWPGPPPDARAIADELTARRVRLSLGGAVNDPTRSGGCCST